jgi:hypothetical protein
VRRDTLKRQKRESGVKEEKNDAPSSKASPANVDGPRRTSFIPDSQSQQ